MPCLQVGRVFPVLRPYASAITVNLGKYRRQPRRHFLEARPPSNSESRGPQVQGPDIPESRTSWFATSGSGDCKSQSFPHLTARKYQSRLYRSRDGDTFQSRSQRSCLILDLRLAAHEEAKALAELHAFNSSTPRLPGHPSLTEPLLILITRPTRINGRARVIHVKVNYSPPRDTLMVYASRWGLPPCTSAGQHSSQVK